MKIVINNCYGSFHLSDEAINLLVKKGIDRETAEYDFLFGSCKRDNKILVEVIEELGKKANNSSSTSLSVVEIPDKSTDWTINEYDGAEEVIYVLDGKIKYAC